MQEGMSTSTSHITDPATGKSAAMNFVRKALYSLEHYLNIRI